MKALGEERAERSTSRDDRPFRAEGAAGVALPIPVVHFVLVPGALVLGLTLGAIRMGEREIFSLAEGTCPFCGTRQRLGAAGRVFRLPRRVHCRNCQRELDLGK